MSPLALSRILATGTIVLTALFVLVCVPWIIQDYLPYQVGSQQSEWIFWIQTFSGNWAPYDHPPVSRWAYALSATIAVVMNNAIGAVLIALAWRIITDRKRRMKLKQVFASRDAATRAALFEKFPSDIPMIKEAFEKGRAQWHSELVLLVGEGEAERLESMLNKEI